MAKQSKTPATTSRLVTKGDVDAAWMQYRCAIGENASNDRVIRLYRAWKTLSGARRAGLALEA